VLLAGAILLALFVVPAPWGLALIVAGIVFEVGETVFWVWLSKRRRPSVGAETLIGAVATVASPCRPDGQVRLRGELWQARCRDGAGPGDRVRVLELDGLTLVVEPV
jgi:membrane-bound serine protease (ClpP class)